MINKDIFKHMDGLSDHSGLCYELLTFFFKLKEISGAFVSGSGASGGMDFYSDLDLGFLCPTEDAKEKVWSQRFDWNLPKWFHRMDADHVKPYFIIYLFDPHIHVDFAFYTTNDLPSQAGGPFTIAFDKELQLSNWIEKVNEPLVEPPDWSNVIHEEERFWTWIHYSWCHIGRGEYYDIATSLGDIRNIIHMWKARLKGSKVFNSRRLEQHGEIEFIEQMKFSFPTPDRMSMKKALLNLIGIHNYQRERVEKLINPKWTTTQSAREKITKLVEEI